MQPLGLDIIIQIPGSCDRFDKKESRAIDLPTSAEVELAITGGVTPKRLFQTPDPVLSR